MIFRRLYRCENCGQKLAKDESIARIIEENAKSMLDDGELLPIRVITHDTNNRLVHRCENGEYGICKVVGYRERGDIVN